MNEKRRTRRRWIWVVLASALLAAIVVAFVAGGPSVVVEVEPVTRGVFERWVEEDGRARVVDRYTVAAPLAGRMERSRWRVGDSVAEGDVLAVIRPMPAPLYDARSRAELSERVGAARARLDAARSTAARLEATAKHSAVELRRAQELWTSKTTTLQSLQRAEVEATSAAKQLAEAKAAAHVAEHELDQARIAAASVQSKGMDTNDRFELTAPVDGRILRVHRQSEGPVATGTPLLEIADPVALEIVVDLLSTDAVAVAQGTEAQITGWGGRGALSGRVRIVEPVASVKVSALGVEEERVDVIVDPVERSPQWARVGDGYRVDVRILVERLPGVLRVPTSALFREAGQWRLFVYRDGRITEQSVEIGSYGARESVVASGLEEGTQVVVRPAPTLRDGLSVALRGE